MKERLINIALISVSALHALHCTTLNRSTPIYIYSVIILPGVQYYTSRCGNICTHLVIDFILFHVKFRGAQYLHTLGEIDIFFCYLL